MFIIIMETETTSKFILELFLLQNYLYSYKFAYNIHSSYAIRPDFNQIRLFSTKLFFTLLFQSNNNCRLFSVAKARKSKSSIVFASPNTWTK